VASWACRLVLAAVLLMAGSGKVLRLAEFIDRLTLLGVPYPAARAAGSFVPWLELTLGGCLALGVMRRESALLAALLLVAFSAFLVFEAGAGDCDCFAVPGLPGLSRGGRGRLLLRNAGLLLAAVVVVWRPGKRNEAARE
jgi:uncharacterized membrane protein YphA (DoxX/SURF4 family)